MKSDQERISAEISDIFKNARVVFLGSETEKFNGHDRLMFTFSVGINEEIANRVIYLMNKGSGPFMRVDSEGEFSVSKSAYPRAYNTLNGFILGIPEGTEDICLKNLKNNKDAIIAALDMTKHTKNKTESSTMITIRR